jgi:hypothetical protein
MILTGKKPENSDKTMFQCHFIHDKSQKEWTGIEPWPSWRREILIMFGDEQITKVLITKISSASCASKSKAIYNISFDICTYLLNIQHLQLPSAYGRSFPLSETSESATPWQ